MGLFILEIFIIIGQALKYNNINIIDAVYLFILQVYYKERIYLNLNNYFEKKVLIWIGIMRILIIVW